MRIGIVGAGISGLSLAHALLKKGYTNITVMDRSAQVGGKCCTVTYGGKTYEMGAIMGLASHKRLQNLMKGFHIKPSDVPLSRGHYTSNGKLASQLSTEERALFIQQLNRLPDVLKTYPWLDTVGFEECPESLQQPFSHWCAHHQLEVLMKVYEQCFTTFGFGLLENVPAGYVLKIITYENLMGFLEISRILTWPKGTGALLQRMGDRIPDLKLTQNVEKIEFLSSESSQDPGIQVTLSSGLQHFDRLIFAGDLTELPHLMTLPPALHAGLQQVEWESFNVYAFKVSGLPEGCGYVPENLKPERRGHLTIWYRRWPNHPVDDLVTVYAYNNPNFSEAEQIESLTSDLKALGGKNIRLYQSKKWKHFPHFNSAALAQGLYNTLRAEQGLGGFYYAGELLSGPNLENCVAFSEQLVETFF